MIKRDIWIEWDASGFRARARWANGWWIFHFLVGAATAAFAGVLTEEHKFGTAVFAGLTAISLFITSTAYFLVWIACTTVSRLLGGDE